MISAITGPPKTTTGDNNNLPAPEDRQSSRNRFVPSHPKERYKIPDPVRTKAGNMQARLTSPVLQRIHLESFIVFQGLLNGVELGKAIRSQSFVLYLRCELTERSFH